MWTYVYTQSSLKLHDPKMNLTLKDPLLNQYPSNQVASISSVVFWSGVKCVPYTSGLNTEYF